MPEYNQPHVHIVTVCFQSASQTIELLESLLAAEYNNWSITVVENGQDGAGYQALIDWKDNHLNVQIEIVRSENNGFAAGCNLGIEAKSAKAAKYIWYLNPDTQVTTSALSILVDTMNRFNNSGVNIGMLGCLIMESRRPDHIHSFYKKFDRGGTAHVPDSVPVNPALLESLPSVDTDVEYITGSCMLVPLSVINNIGKMDETYFLNYEEIDWQERMRQAGYAIRVQKDTLVYHTVSTSFTGYTMGYYLSRNQLYWLAKWHPDFVKRVHSHILFNLTNLKHLLRGRFGYLCGLVVGVKDYDTGKMGRK